MPDGQVSDVLPSFRHDGRLAVVTGSSEGIGRAIAEAYAFSDAEVVLVSRRREQLVEVQRTIELGGGKAHVIPADLSRLEEIRSLESCVLKLVENRAEMIGCDVHAACTR